MGRVDLSTVISILVASAAALPASAQSGRPPMPVDVVNEPVVNLANPEMIVKNDETMPIPVVVLEEPERGERVQIVVDVSVEGGMASGCTDVEVAPDRRIELDQISGDVRLPANDERGVALVFASPALPGPGAGLYHYFPLTAAGANISVGPHATSYYFNEQSHIFSDGRLRLCLLRGPTPSPFTGGAFMRVALSGRLVALPD
jgi:hypothetical protein